MNFYFIQNIFIFLEECLVKSPSKGDFFTLSPDYIKNENTKNALLKDILELYPDLTYLPEKDCEKKEFRTVFAASYQPKNRQDWLDGLKSTEIVLVEDGLGDYELTEPDQFYNSKTVYLFRPESARNQAKNLKKLPENSEVLEKFQSLYQPIIDRLKKYPKSTPVLFTTPLSEDFDYDQGITDKILKKISSIYHPEKLILKRHPRDHFSYLSNNFEIIECPQNIPGQFIDRIFTGPKIYLAKSTVGFMGDSPETILDLKSMV